MIKKLVYLPALLSLLLMTLAGCSANSPEKVAEKFFTAMNNEDFEEAKKYVSEESIKMFDFVVSMASMAGEQEGARVEKAKNAPVKVLRTEMSEDGNSATVYFEAAEGEEPEKVDLKKDKNNDWKVVLSGK